MVKSPLLAAPLLLSLIGLFFISVSSLAEASASFNNPYYFVQKQVLWFLLGLVALIICSKINLHHLARISSTLYFSSLALLALTLLPQLGRLALGARRWLNFGLFGFQPAELVKLSAVIFFAHLFSKPQTANIKNLLVYLLPSVFFILLQPNFSTAILLILIIICLYYLSNGPILPLFIACLFFLFLTIPLIVLSPYRLTRFQTLINPNQNQEAAYHYHQIVYALASGGLLGKGFGSSDQKYRFIPKISTDSILAVIGEETGFIGLIFIFYLYLILINYLLKLSARSANSFSSLILAGIASWIACQSLINISAIVALIPITGIPLPFISYGGSSLTSLMAAIGLAHNIQKQNHSLLYSNNETTQHRSYRQPPHSGHRANKSAKI